MIGAIALMTLGIALIWSAIKGLSITQIFQGATGNPLDPKGGGQDARIPSDPEHPPLTAPGDIPFTGRNSILLWNMENDAKERFHLHISSECRTQAQNDRAGGAQHSNHLCIDVDGKCKCRAFDASGSAADMLAFARYADKQPGLEVFHDPAGLVAPGFDHSDHVHVGSDD